MAGTAFSMRLPIPAVSQQSDRLEGQVARSQIHVCGQEPPADNWRTLAETMLKPIRRARRKRFVSWPAAKFGVTTPRTMTHKQSEATG